MSDTSIINTANKTNNIEYGMLTHSQNIYNCIVVIDKNNNYLFILDDKRCLFWMQNDTLPYDKVNMITIRI